MWLDIGVLPSRGRNHPTLERVSKALYSDLLFFFLRFIFIIFYWKGGYTERRDREEDLPSDDSLPK